MQKRSVVSQANDDQKKKAAALKCFKKLYSACWEGDYERAKHWLHCADSASIEYSTADCNDRRSLLEAAMFDCGSRDKTPEQCERLVKLLVSYGADISEPTTLAYGRNRLRNYRSILHRQPPKALKILLAYEPDPFIKDYDGRTPREWANKEAAAIRDYRGYQSEYEEWLDSAKMLKDYEKQFMQNREACFQEAVVAMRVLYSLPQDIGRQQTCLTYDVICVLAKFLLLRKSDFIKFKNLFDEENGIDKKVNSRDKNKVKSYIVCENKIKADLSVLSKLSPGQRVPTAVTWIRFEKNAMTVYYSSYHPKDMYSDECEEDTFKFTITDREDTKMVRDVLAGVISHKKARYQLAIGKDSLAVLPTADTVPWENEEWWAVMQFSKNNPIGNFLVRAIGVGGRTPGITPKLLVDRELLEKIDRFIKDGCSIDNIKENESHNIVSHVASWGKSLYSYFTGYQGGFFPIASVSSTNHASATMRPK